MKRRTFLSLMGAAALTSSMMLTGCGAGSGDDRKIVRIGHVQSQTHPDHLGLEAFANYINEKLGDKYRVEVYPSELLGSQTEMVQLTQTGAIDFVVASTAIMETFSAKYQIFNLPYLFSSVEAYHEAMDDPEVTDPIFKFGGFQVSQLAMGQQTSSLGVAVGVFYWVMPICGVIILVYSVLNIIGIANGSICLDTPEDADFAKVEAEMAADADKENKED